MVNRLLPPTSLAESTTQVSARQVSNVRNHRIADDRCPEGAETNVVFLNSRQVGVLDRQVVEARRTIDHQTSLKPTGTANVKMNFVISKIYL